jgi:molybdenum cofactor biosynthesis protein A
MLSAVNRVRVHWSSSGRGVVRYTSTHPLLDQFGRFHDYLRVSLTERCNLRCSYCMPPEGVKLTPDSELLSAKELLYVIEAFVSLGVKKVRLTGGEPTLRKDIVPIAKQITSFGIKDLGITTNGLLLERFGAQLRDAGVNRLNVSLDTLDSSRFVQITKRKGHERVVAGILHALSLGFASVKINCVIKRGLNDDEISAFVTLTRKLPLEIRFLEYMPFNQNGWEEDKVFSYADMVTSIKGSFPAFEQIQNKDPNPTAKLWKVPGFIGTVGFITAMTDEFCRSCNRVRLTADGNVKVCLFGESEVSVRELLQNPSHTKQDILESIAQAITSKKEKLGGYSNPKEISLGKNRPMILIGG